MKNEKTREEIVAEREAKKKAKLLAKKKLNAATAAATPTEETKPKPTVPLETTAKETQSQPTQGTSSVASSKSKKNEGRKGKKSESDTDIRSAKTESPKVAATTNRNCPPTQKTQVTVPVQIKPVAQINQKVMVSTPRESDFRPPAEGKGDNKENETKGAAVEDPDDKTANLTKAELKAARRLKQEAQRAAKTQKPAPMEPRPAPDKTADRKPVTKGVDSRKGVGAKPRVVAHKVKLFNHLYCDEDTLADSFSHLHPAVIALGVRYATRVVVGSNARCFALMNALKQVVQDYTTPQQKDFARGLESCLQPCLAFLHRCRPLSVSMTNAVKHLRWQTSQLPNEVTDTDAKGRLRDAIDTYLRDQIDVAAQAICITVQRKISDGDVILTYGCSSLVQRILTEAHDNGKKFRAIVVDARPFREGLQMLHRLSRHGVRCSYVLTGAASCMMREATKVLMGAHALLANGHVMSRAGSAQIAMLARSYNVPVLVCCETYKFCERVQTDALVYNEIGDPEALVSGADSPLADWRSVADLTPLNLTYDITPPDLVTAVVTELAILPCTSVPVILRIKPTDSHH